MAEAQRRPDHDESPNGSMGFLEHLDELRTRIIRSCVALGAGMLIAFSFAGRIRDVVMEPVRRVLPPEASLVTSSPGEGLAFYLDLALLGGVVLAAPFIAYQAWRFIAPGLYARERRLVAPFVALAACGTAVGTLFSHFVLFPSMMAFFARFNPPQVLFLPRVEDTFGLYRNVLIAMVAVFQIPTLVFFLARLGLVTAGFLWRHLRYAILLSFVAAALLTPSPDPWNQVVFAVPMIALYAVSIGIAWVVAPRHEDASTPAGSPHLKLVFAATIIEQASRSRHRARTPRAWRWMRRAP